MGKKVVQEDTIVSQKPQKKSKKVKESKPVPEEQPQSKAKPIDDFSKKIKKAEVPASQPKKKKQPKKKPEIEKEKETIKSEIEPLNENNYSDFVRTATLKYSRIRKRTIQMLTIDKNLVKKAVKALLAHNEKSKEGKFNLLDTGDDFIYLEIVMSQVPSKHSIKPIQIKLPAPIYGAQYQSKFAVISQDPQRTFKDKIQDLEIPTIAKVIGYTKMTKNYPQYVDKRKLAYEYDLFFCDYKIYNLLRKPTGKAFYERKKIPYPIDCQDVPEHLKEEYPTYQEYLNSLGNHTYFVMGNGPVYTVKIARLSMATKDVVKNIIHGAYNTIPHILRDAIKHTKIRQLSIKTAGSISLPILTQLAPEEIKAFNDTE